MNPTTTTLEEVPLKAVVPVPVDWLVLDYRNPRLIHLEEKATDEDIIAQLYRAEDLRELLQSIASNGYLDIEPLIVLAENGHLVVLEGNRRLAAIRLLREPELAKRVGERAGTRITLPDISNIDQGTFKSISVYRVASREDARSFIGFKHINGAARWDSYAKARFAADWYRSDNVSLAEVANRIGDRHDTVKRMVNAIYVLDQAQQENVFDIADRMNPRFSFSHLYTALSRPVYMRFLGLGPSWSRFDPNPNPVPNQQIERLSEVLMWIYGSKERDIEPIVTYQNPDIRRLGDILESSEGLAILRANGSLREAYESTQPAGRKFSESLVRARREIQEAANSLRGFDDQGGSLIGVAEDIVETSQMILSRMRKKVQESSGLDE